MGDDGGHQTRLRRLLQTGGDGADADVDITRILFIPSFIFNLTIGAVVLICRQLAQLLPRYAVYRDIRKLTRGGVPCLNFICPDCPSPEHGIR
jgi:hypothetical protein